MPRFAANLHWLFTEHAFLDRFGAARAAGFRAVEFPSPYEHPAAAIRERLDAHGLECVLFNLPSGERARGDFGIACRPERIGEFRAGVARAVEYARVLGVHRINCIAGRALGGDDPLALERTLAANLAFAARALADEGLELVIEPINTHDVPGFHVATAARGIELVEAVRAENFGLQLDFYHTAMMGDDCAGTFARVRDRVWHLQFADAPGRGEPGTGALDLASLFAAVDASGYEGWLSAEYRPSGATADSLGWFPAHA